MKKRIKKQLTQEEIIKKLKDIGICLSDKFDLNQPNCSYAIGKDKRDLIIK